MKITAGNLKGRKLIIPRFIPNTRPTTALAKEALFNILANKLYFENKNMLDLFAGTGSISFEFLSRGGKSSTLIESDQKMIKAIQSSTCSLQLNRQINVIRDNVENFIKINTTQFDLVFAGPPYKYEKLNVLPDLIFKYKGVANSGYFILEHTTNISFKENIRLVDQRKYGTTIFSFFK